MHALSVWQQLPWYLTTAPQPRTDTSERFRVTERLNDLVTGHRVTVVHAPSGYGKTVAAADWARQAGHTVAWLSMPKTVECAAEFLRGFASAIMQAAPPSGHLLSGVRRALAEGGCDFADLVRAVGEAGTRVTVVVDDAHRATTLLAGDEVGAMLEHGPPNLRVVLVGHGALATALSRGILHGAIGVLGADELAFTLDEIGDLLDVADAARVLEVSKGWPIAVRMAHTGSGFGATGDALLTDYVADEILGPLPADLRSFILAATTTSRLDASLAAAVSGNDDAAGLLEECVRRHLFLHRFSNESDPRAGSGTSPDVFAWHDLFARHCRQILAREDPDRARALQLTAAGHLHRSRPLAAAELASAAADPTLAADILLASWITLVIESDSVAVESAVDALADADLDISRRSQLSYVRACCRGMRGDRRGARALFDEADRRHPPTDPAQRITRSVAALLHSDDHDRLHAELGTLVRIVENPDERNALPPDVRACCTFLIGWVLTRLRIDPVQGEAFLRSAVADCRAAGLTAIARRATVNHAFALAFAGQFTAVIDTLDGAAGDVDATTWDYYDDGLETFARGWTSFWRGELPDALEFFAANAVLPVSMAGYPPLSRIYRLMTAAILGDRGEIVDAEPDLAPVEDSTRHGVPWPVYLRLAKARVAEVDHRPDLVEMLADEVESEANVPVSLVFFAGMIRRQGDHQRARRILHRIGDTPVPTYVDAYRLLTAAVMERADGDATRAHALLERALELTEPESIVLPYLDNTDEPTTALLTAHLAATSRRAHLTECLAARTPFLRNASAGQPGLTRREQEVLRYLGTALTMTEIAQTLFVSQNTLKSHCQSLYRKLGATSRREAVRFAGRDRLAVGPGRGSS